MIQYIQDRTRTAIASMASGMQTVQHGVVTTTQADESLERIIRHGRARRRHDRSDCQPHHSRRGRQSSASLDSIHTLSHENLVAMASTAEGIESLRATAIALEQQVDRFNISSARLQPA